MERDSTLQTLGFRHLALLLCLWQSAGAANAVTANPYEGIVGRNVFGLKPPTVTATPTVAPVAAAIDIKLQGISTILDRKQVLLKVKTAARPPEPAKEQSYLWSEGQGEADIEVLSIDAVNGIVTIKNHGETLPPLTMKDDAEKPAVGAALPSLAAANPQVTRLPGVIAPNTTTSAPQMDSAVVPTPGGNGRTIPTRSLRNSSTDGTGVGGVAPQRSTEETAALYEINRAKNELLRQSGISMPALPQHPMFKGAQ